MSYSKIILPAAALSFILALSGCTASGDGSREPLSSEASTDGSLAYVHDKAIENLDPDRNINGTPLAFLFPAYDRLIHLTPDGGYIPGLAEEWTWEDDGQSLLLKLRKDVTFHDGTPFNAEAVKFNLERSGTLEGGNATSRGAVSPIADISVLDEFTVKLSRIVGAEYDVAWALLESRLSENAGMMISPTAANNENIDLMPVGAGPFRVVDFTNESVEYERFEGYWDPDAILLDKLTIYQALEPDAVLAGIESGRFHVGSIGASQIDRAESAGVEVDVTETTTIYQLWTNHSRPPLDDENFRKALLYGIDRQGIVDAVFDGHGTVTPQPFVQSSESFNPDCGPDKYPYDPERARELVAASAYANDPKVGLMIATVPEWTEVGELMQAMLKEAGMDVEIQPLELAQHAQYFAGEYDMTIGRRGRLAPLEALENTWAATGNSNPGGQISPAIDAALEEIAQETDPKERRKLVQEASCTVIEEGHSPGLWSVAKVWALDECVVGFQPPSTPYPEFRGVGIDRSCA